MKIIQLRYFKAICDYNGVSKAAEALYVTQPAITIALKNLEEEFGVSLFNRNSNKFELTEAGRFLLQRVDIVLSNIDNLENSMKDLSAQINTIKAGIPPMIGAFMFSKLIFGFKQNNPEVNFEVTERGSLEVVRDVENGILDMGIVACQKGDLNNNIEFKELVNTEFYAVVGSKHKFANKESVSLKELSDEQIILFNKGSYQYKHFLNEFDRVNIVPKIMLNSYQLITINQCLAHDNCVAFMYKDVLPYLNNVKGIRLEHPYKVKIGLVYNKNNVLVKNVKSFIEYCIETCANKENK